MNDYAGLVEYIVRNMVDHPDAVVVEAQPGRGRSQTIEISLDPEDVGRVIGKGGRNIEAIRAVVKAASIKDHERVNVEVLADELPPAAAPDDAAEGESPVDAAASEEAGAGAEVEAEAAAAPIAADAPAETTDAAPEHHAEVHDAAE
ncbi:MAG TPA: KH domain-containing protein [Candidatus Dormibacteraeota bacterium]|jgi:hypothetical protein|nr:KH domain-containing protein [Candidatus Dormibacteraeota bacterium]